LQATIELSSWDSCPVARHNSRCALPLKSQSTTRLFALLELPK
jgi:hypothetical protein